MLLCILADFDAPRREALPGQNILQTTSENQCTFSVESIWCDSCYVLVLACCAVRGVAGAPAGWCAATHIYTYIRGQLKRALPTEDSSSVGSPGEIRAQHSDERCALSLGAALGFTDQSRPRVGFIPAEIPTENNVMSFCRGCD